MHKLHENHPGIKVHIDWDTKKSVGGLDYDEHLFQYLPVQIRTGILGLRLIITCIFVYKCGQSFSALFLNDVEKPMQQIQVGIPIPFF